MYRNLVVILALLVVLAASAAHAGDNKPPLNVGWFVQCTVDGCPTTVTVGGSDSGYGTATADQNYIGLHMGLWAGGQLAGQTVYGSSSPIQAVIYIWSNDPTIKTANIHWWTMGTDYNQNFYYLKSYWPGNAFSLDFSGQGVNMPIGTFNQPREGWITAPISASPDCFGGYKLNLNVNVPASVPEPTGLLAILMGLTGFGGVAWRNLRRS